ncbi:MAG: hypothetical protein K2H03_00560, partial [Muribaculaceae bacterium]|nr:hypothetical protein [Muribaculaceae bacterium]
MKFIRLTMIALAALSLSTACQDKDIEALPAAVAPISESAISGSLEGNDYIWTWTAPQDLAMQVTVYNGQAIFAQEKVDGNSYIHRDIDTNVEYTYVFKLTDGSNLSEGVVKTYTRKGATRVSGLSLAQTERQGGYDVSVSWDRNESASSIELSATNGSRSISESRSSEAVSFLIPDVDYGEEWTVTL